MSNVDSETSWLTSRCKISICSSDGGLSFVIFLFLVNVLCGRILCIFCILFALFGLVGFNCCFGFGLDLRLLTLGNLVLERGLFSFSSLELLLDSFLSSLSFLPLYFDSLCCGFKTCLSSFVGFFTRLLGVLCLFLGFSSVFGPFFGVLSIFLLVF